MKHNEDFILVKEPRWAVKPERNSETNYNSRNLRMKRSFVAAFLVIALAIVNECYSQIEYGQIYTDPAINIHERLMKSTFRISGEDSSGMSIEGTCFILEKLDSTRGTKKILITARHVLEDISDEYITVNYPCEKDSLLGNCRKLIRVRDRNTPLWIGHKDSVIDIAVLEISTLEFYNNNLMSTEYLATENLLKQFQLKPGDKLFCIGYPHGVSANELGYPILKGGYVASYPLLPTTKNQFFLFDCEVFEANSGSPVYARESGRVYVEGVDYIFDGNCVQLICGIIVSKNNVKVDLTKNKDNPEDGLESLHLAKVIPSTYILELIKRL